MIKNRVKLLFLDIEMAPMKVYTWGLFDQNIPTNFIIERSSMLSFAAKWQGSDKIIYFDVSKQKNLRDDSKLIKKLSRLLNMADVVVSHNIAFDKKKSNTRIISNGEKPVSPYNEICTLKIARKHFKFDSNKLSDLAIVLNVPVKKYTHSKFAGNDLFVQCVEGNPEAWAEMRIYNPTDIEVLEGVYNKLALWEPNINYNSRFEDNENRCPCCDSFLVKKKGFRYKKLGKFQKYICTTCGKWFQSGTNLLSKIKRRDMLR